MSATKHPELDAALAELTDKKEGVYWTTDVYGNEYGWYHLRTPDLLLDAGRLLLDNGARLATITPYIKEVLTDPEMDAAYHFEVGKSTLYTITVTLDQECPVVDSITPLFPCADWHEREMRELYAVQVSDHPDPRRLFLDETLEEGILNEAIPLSIMMNGACTTDLWERILKDRNLAEQKSDEEARS